MNYESFINDFNTKFKNTNNENIKNNIDYFLKKLDITLPNLEKIGATLLVIGYSTFLNAANLDISDALNINNSNITPFNIFVSGQKLILIGYTILFIVSSKRLEEQILRVKNDNENIPLNLFYKIKISYLISLYANILRLQAFLQLEANDSDKSSTE